LESLLQLAAENFWMTSFLRIVQMFDNTYLWPLKAN